MNPETNKFEMLEIYNDCLSRNSVSKLYRPDGTVVPTHWSVFCVGENYIINNYTFKCVYIGETSILFEPVGVVDIGGDK